MSILFDMPIDDTSSLKIEGSIVVVGVIVAGEIQAGMRLEIRSSTAIIPVSVVALEAGPGKSVSSARVGDRVGVLLKGARKDQVASGSHLVAGSLAGH